MATNNSGVREIRYRILARYDNGKALCKQSKDVPKAKNFSSANFTQNFGQWPLNLFAPHIPPNRIHLHEKTKTNSITGRRKSKNNFAFSHSRRNYLNECSFVTKHRTATGPRPIESSLTTLQDWFRATSKFANFRHKNLSNIQTRLLACIEITPHLRRRCAVRTRRTATNIQSIESPYHLVFEFRFVDGVSYAVCRRVSTKVKGHAPFRIVENIVNSSKYVPECSETLRNVSKTLFRVGSKRFDRTSRCASPRRRDFDRFAPSRTAEKALNYSILTFNTILTSLELRIRCFETFSIHSQKRVKRANVRTSLKRITILTSYIIIKNQGFVLFTMYNSAGRV